MSLYRLDVFLANGKSIGPYQKRIIEEMDKSFADGMSARNPKELRNRFYDANKDCVVAEMYSKAELSSPGHLLSNVSKRLLKSDDQICLALSEELLGNRLFKIEAENIENAKSAVPSSFSHCKLMQIISTLLLEDVDAKERHQNEEVIKEIKSVLLKNQYVVKKFKLED